MPLAAWCDHLRCDAGTCRSRPGYRRPLPKRSAGATMSNDTSGIPPGEHHEEGGRAYRPYRDLSKVRAGPVDSRRSGAPTVTDPFLLAIFSLGPHVRPDRAGRADRRRQGGRRRGSGYVFVHLTRRGDEPVRHRGASRRSPKPPPRHHRGHSADGALRQLAGSAADILPAGLCPDRPSGRRGARAMATIRRIAGFGAIGGSRSPQRTPWAGNRPCRRWWRGTLTPPSFASGSIARVGRDSPC